MTETWRDWFQGAHRNVKGRITRKDVSVLQVLNSNELNESTESKEGHFTFSLGQDELFIDTETSKLTPGTQREFFQ